MPSVEIQVHIAAPTPVPGPVNAANRVTLANKSGAAVKDYPLQIGRPFMVGEIAHAPQIVMPDGSPLLTQADIKNRHPDGSVKFAVIAAVIPSLPASGAVVLNFQDQPAGDNTPIPSADLLAQFPDFDAVIKISGSVIGSANAASARAMLADGNCKPWTSGPVAQTMICADRSATRKYDMGSGQWRSLHPEFVVTFWPATKQVFVRYVGEVSNVQALEAFPYDLELTAGKASPQSVYKQAGIQHSIATRWTRTAWLGGTPEPKVNIDHNIGYLADTYWLPNFDRSLKIPEAVLASTYTSSWGIVGHKIGDAGIWMKGMPNVAYHPDIGHMPLWMNQAVYSGDWRAREVMLGQADLAGAFPMQLREGDPNKKADRAQTVPAIGLPITVYARPTSWGLDPRDQALPTDKIIVRSPKSSIGSFDLYNYGGFVPDLAHQPDPFFVPYLMTGDPFYLDGLQLWCTINSFGPPGYRNYANAVMYGGQVRADAWELRTRLHAALATPDSDPMKAIFDGMVDDALAYWEGVRGFKGTKYENTPNWKFGYTRFGTVGDYYNGLGPHPLGWWMMGGNTQAFSPSITPDRFDLTVFNTQQSPWQQNFLTIELGRAVELGYAADRLFAFVGKNIIGQLTTDNYNRNMLGLYCIPDTKKGPTGAPVQFATWADVMTAWSPTFRSRTVLDYFPSTGREAYWDVARGAAGMAATLPSGAQAWTNFNTLIATQTTLTGQIPDWNTDPTWAILPRNGMPK